MKRIYFFIYMFLAVAGVAWAQRPVGDTLTAPDTDYFNNNTYLNCWPISPEYSDTGWHIHRYDLIMFQRGITSEMRTFRHRDGNYIGGIQMFADRPIKVVGIAVCAYMQRPMDTITSALMHYYDIPRSHEMEPGLFFLNTRDTTLKGRITDSAILYKPTDTGLMKLVSVPWRIEYPHRFIHLPPEDTLDWGFFNFTNPNMPWTLIANYERDPVLPLYEVMFDTPVVVEDSFVVASTALNNEGSISWAAPPANPSLGENMWLWDHNPTRYYNIISPYYINTTIDSTCITWVKYRNHEWRRSLQAASMRDSSTDPITYSYYSLAYPFFPIIEPGFDTTLCHEARNIRVAERTDSSATLMWDSGDGGPWEVAFGKITDQWEDFSFFTVSSPTVTLTGLEIGTVYFALVRSYCSVTHEFGDWSSPFEGEIYHQHGPGEPDGIDNENEGDLSRFTQLMPNPAHDVVNVLSSYRLSRVAVYDLNGHKVAEQEACGIAATIDIAALPKGTYIVAIHTPYGIATKRLVKN